MKLLRRSAAFVGAFGMLSIGLAGSSAGLFHGAAASGGLGCGGAGGGPTPGPTQVFASHFRGLSATESFTSTSGSTKTDVGVDVLQEMLALASTGSASVTAVFVTVTVADVTDPNNPIDLVEASGCATTQDFQIDQTLSSATLGATAVPLQDFISGYPSTAVVSGDWTGIGAVTRQTNVSHFHSGAFTSAFNFIGFDRQALASGTVSDPDASFDGAADVAELDKVEAGGVTVCLAGAC